MGPYIIIYVIVIITIVTGVIPIAISITVTAAILLLALIEASCGGEHPRESYGGPCMAPYDSTALPAIFLSFVCARATHSALVFPAGQGITAA